MAEERCDIVSNILENIERYISYDTKKKKKKKNENKKIRK